MASALLCRAAKPFQFYGLSVKNGGLGGGPDESVCYGPYGPDWWVKAANLPAALRVHYV